MSQPLPPEIILPSGRAAFLNPYKGTYTTSRPYALRMQRNFARGLSQSEARGHRVSPQGFTEAQIRRQQAQAAGFQTPWERFTLNFERRYGFSYRYWRFLKRRWIDAINARSSPGLQITPIWIAQELQNASGIFSSFLAINQMPSGKPWIEQRLDEKLADMEAYQDENDKEPGFLHFIRRDNFRPIEWWYYH